MKSTFARPAIAGGILTCIALVGGANAPLAQAAVGPHQYVVTATLDGRLVRDLNDHSYPNRYASGSTVTIVCQDSGPAAYGSSIWDLTSNTDWIPDHYVQTGHSGFVDELPRCVDGHAPTGSSGHGFLATATLDGRSVKDLANHAYPNRYAAGTVVNLLCQDSGPSAYGSTIWDWTTESYWVPDYYIKTGATGFSPAVPRCSGSETSAPVAANSFKVTATLDGRTAKDLSNHAYPNRYPAGSWVEVQCQDTGASAYGSTIWDLTTQNIWIPDYYVKTGYGGFDPNLPRCSGTTSSPGRTFVVSTTLDGRTVKDTSNHAAPDRYPAGSSVTVVCQDYGGYTYGGYAIWDKLDDGYWVVDYYVRTGVDGFVSGVPRCSPATQPPAGTDPVNSSPGTPTASGSAAAALAVQTARNAIAAHSDYVWGGGHGTTPGATKGYCDGVNGYLNGSCYASNHSGFDCSGLMRYVYWTTTGVDIGSGSTGMWWAKGSGNGRTAPSSSFQANWIDSPQNLAAGDLVLARPDRSGAPGHTFLIVSNDPAHNQATIAEAARTSIGSRVTTMSYSSMEFMRGWRLK